MTASELVVAVDTTESARTDTRHNTRRSPKIRKHAQPVNGELNSEGRKRGPIRLPLYGFTYS